MQETTSYAYYHYTLALQSPGTERDAHLGPGVILGHIK